MKLVKMWQLFVKPHEEITAAYAKIEIAECATYANQLQYMVDGQREV